MTLVEELQREIDQWMSSRRNGNLSILSRLSGVSYPTLRRIMQAEFTPNLETVMQVISVIRPDKEARDFLCKHFPDFSQLFRKQEEVGYQMMNMAGLLQTFTKEEFIVYHMAAGSGVALERLNEKLGDQAKLAIQRLSAADFIEVREGKVFNKIKNINISNVGELLHQMKLAVECFDKEKVSEKGSHCALLSERISQEGIEEASLAIIECKKRLHEIYTDPKYFGDRVYVSVLSSSFLD